MKKSMVSLLCYSILSVSIAHSGVAAETSNISFEESSEVLEANNFDTLQQMFCDLTFDTTAIDIEDMIYNNSLEYTKTAYNKSSSGKSINYKIAYTKKASHQKYSEPGDYLEVSFDQGQDGKFMNATYYNESKIAQVLLYNYGTWWDFRDSNAEDYSGYYYINSTSSSKGGITVKYSNGYETKTNYYKCEDASSALNRMGIY